MNTELTSLPEATALPLPTLLSQVLVAFTIEFDNEFERLTPHWTTTSRPPGPQAGPWLASMAMWSNFMRMVDEEGITVRELRRLSRTPKLQLNGMERWGYVVVAPDPADKRSKPPQGDWLVRPTAKGRMASQVWEPLFGAIEDRWRQRFGSGAIDALRESLWAVVNRLDCALPEYLPVLGYGLAGEVDESQPASADPVAHGAADLTLPALLSKVLLAFTLEFERESHVSLAICANVLRVAGETPVRLRDLPRLSGLSKEAIHMATGYLKARGYAAIESDRSASRGKVMELTPKGRIAQATYRRLLHEIEERWHTRFGAAAIRNVRQSLEAFFSEGAHPQQLLFKGMEPHPGGWRASASRPDTLPHYPMVLHRGGYPDGS
jgi:DNA-binding MarR family transcriptional regulator